MKGNPLASVLPKPKKKACWNLISVSSPLFAALWIFLLWGRVQDSGWGWGYVGLFLTAIAGAALLGLAAGIIALCRNERWPLLTRLGLAINLYPFLRFLLAGL